MTDAGYSGTPLGKKLGYREGMRVFVDGMPDPIRHAVEKSIVAKPDWQFIPKAGLESAHIFVSARAALEAKIAALLPLLGQGTFIWVSWPKKASKVPTDITEDIIRDVCLPMGLVDVKVRRDIVRSQIDTASLLKSLANGSHYRLYLSP